MALGPVGRLVGVLMGLPDLDVATLMGLLGGLLGLGSLRTVEHVQGVARQTLQAKVLPRRAA